VLDWAGNRLVSWGLNSGGALGTGSTTPSFTSTPGAVTVTTPLAGQTILSAACGFNHSVALCSDGTVVAWGTNSKGQVGDSTTGNRANPVAVSTGVPSALNGRLVVAVAAGNEFSVALCNGGDVGRGHGRSARQ
jgi:alpha-tubulin suppressor-like RCC1 family protein